MYLYISNIDWVSLYKILKNYYPQVFLEKYKNVAKEEMCCFDEKNFDEKIQIKKIKYVSLFLEKIY